MAQHNITGAEGENKAAQFLKLKGYEILAQNFKADCGEVDIIARKDGLIIFAEVKTRSTAAFGWPEESVSELKQQRIAATAELWLDQTAIEYDIRFDIISIVTVNGQEQIYHIIDAFAP